MAYDPALKLWTCAEVLLDRSLGYGTYNWKLSHDHSKTTPFSVVGLFLYADREPLVQRIASSPAPAPLAPASQTELASASSRPLPQLLPRGAASAAGNAPAC